MIDTIIWHTECLGAAQSDLGPVRVARYVQKAAADRARSGRKFDIRKHGAPVGGRPVDRLGNEHCRRRQIACVSYCRSKRRGGGLGRLRRGLHNIPIFTKDRNNLALTLEPVFDLFCVSLSFKNVRFEKYSGFCLATIWLCSAYEL